VVTTFFLGIFVLESHSFFCFSSTYFAKDSVFKTGLSRDIGSNSDTDRICLGSVGQLPYEEFLGLLVATRNLESLFFACLLALLVLCLLRVLLVGLSIYDFLFLAGL